MMSAPRQLRKLLARPEMMVVPGVHDGLSAQLARHAGFESIFLGSYAVTASAFGMPDSGLVPVAKLIEAYRTIVEATELPALCDIDDGGGSPLHIARNIRLVEKAGISGAQMEDLDLSRGKYLPGMGKRLIPSARMVTHIKAAADARQDADTIIMARCDARDAGTLSEAIDRVGAYSEAGADLVVLPGLKIEEVPQIVSASSAPLAYMFMRTDNKDAADQVRARARCEIPDVPRLDRLERRLRDSAGVAGVAGPKQRCHSKARTGDVGPVECRRSIGRLEPVCTELKALCMTEPDGASEV